MSAVSNTIIIESNRQIAYKQQLQALEETNAETIDTLIAETFPNNKWRTHLEFGQQINLGDEISLEAAMINDIGGGDEVMEFIGRTGVLAKNGENIDDTRARVEFAYYINNRYQFNFIHPKSTLIVNRDFLGIDYGGPNTFGTGEGSGTTIPTDVQRFAAFRKCYPYQAMEGYSHTNAIPRVYTVIPDSDFPTFMKPNLNVFNPSDQKFYIGNESFTGPYFTPGIPLVDQTQIWDFERSPVDLEVPYGFSTPAAVAERMTAQLHQRSGPASNWVVKNATPLIFKIGTDGKITDQVMPGISDKTYQTFPTSTGQLFYSRLNDGTTKTQGWGCAFKGEIASNGDAVPVGTNYNENQGQYQFWTRTLCENIGPWRAACIWLQSQRQPFVTTDIVDYKNLTDLSSFTGPSQLRQFTISGKTYNTGLLGGGGSLLLDTTETYTNPFSFTNSLTKISTDPLTFNNDINNWHIRKNDVFALSLTLNDYNLDNAVESFEFGKYVFQSTTNADPSSEDYIAGIAVDFVLGRIDDEATLSSADRIIYLPCPNMINGRTNSIAPFTTQAGSTPGNTMAGKSYTSDMEAPLYTNTAVTAIEGRLLGASRGTGTVYKVPTFVYMDGGYKADDAMENNLRNHKGVQVGLNLYPHRDGSLFQLAIPNGDKNELRTYYDKLRNLNGGRGCGLVPVFYKTSYATGDNLKLLNIPFLATVTALENGIQVPAPCIGEYFGVGSPTLTQNNIGKIVTTQKVNDTVYGQGTDLDPEDYMPYIYCGASDSLINFDGGYSRFTFSQLHTTVRPGNGVFQNLDLKENTSPETSSMTAYETEAALCTIGGLGDKINYIDQTAIPRPQPIISAQCGVAIVSLAAFLNESKPTESSTLLPLLTTNIQQYTNTLLDKLGFSYEQLMPEYGLPDNEFNRGNYNRYLGFRDVDLMEKQNNMVKPFTTNAYISASIIISMCQGIATKPSSSPPVGSAEGPVPTANLGALIAKQAITNATSDLLIAKDMPQKLDYPYLVVYTDIVRNPLYYGGPDGSQKLSAIAYITRNYASGDYFYSFATGWSYTADQDYIITDITTDIRLPDGSPAPIDKNSSVIYKIQTTKAMPPPPAIISQALQVQEKIDAKQEKK